MKTGRLISFSDGVIAIIITIMVLELKTPKEASFGALMPMAPVLLSYIMSFIYTGIYWNNHHHLLALVKRASAGILWANLHLLFWLSLVPFVTGWMGQTSGCAEATAAYGFVLFMSGASYWILQQAIIRSQGPDSILKQAIGKDIKGVASVGLYVLAMAAAYFLPWISWLIFVIVAGMWVIPDRRLEGFLLVAESSVNVD